MALIEIGEKIYGEWELNTPSTQQEIQTGWKQRLTKLYQGCSTQKGKAANLKQELQECANEIESLQSPKGIRISLFGFKFIK